MRLAHLGTDAASAPDVPAAVTARIGAALRAAPPRPPTPPQALPRLSRLQHHRACSSASARRRPRSRSASRSCCTAAPTPPFPSGPTAERSPFGAQCARRHAQSRGHAAVMRPSRRCGNTPAYPGVCIRAAVISVRRYQAGRKARMTSHTYRPRRDRHRLRAGRLHRGDLCRARPADAAGVRGHPVRWRADDHHRGGELPRLPRRHHRARS